MQRMNLVTGFGHVFDILGGESWRWERHNSMQKAGKMSFKAACFSVPGNPCCTAAVWQGGGGGQGDGTATVRSSLPWLAKL